MKIDRVILSSDENPLYLDFWPSVSKVWSEVFNIKPTLAVISDNKDILNSIDNTYGDVIRFDVVDNVPVYLQALWIRYWIPKQYPDDVCIISDIDMIPLSKWYFIEQINNIDNNDYVHLNPCYVSYGTLPSCYHVAKGKLFNEILNLHNTWEESVIHLNNLNVGQNPGGELNGKNQWFADEKHSSDLLFNWRSQNPDRVHFLEREEDRRVDRSNWSYNIDLLKNGYYYDSHSIRPYLHYKNEIDKLINLI
jgi:hypothetical protein